MWKTSLINLHYFHTSSSSSSSIGKMGKVLRKVMGQSSRKKRIFSESGILPSAEMFSKGSNEGRHSGSARRVSVLNKLFMKNITDLLATGEYSSEFLGHGIEINRVQIAPDYNGLNVFWIARGTESDDVTENLFKKHAGYLRHELSSLRVMGCVPRIQFVKDKRYSQIVEVDTKLEKADFGEDHTPIEMATKLKTQLELFTSLPSDVRKGIEKLDEDFLEEDEIEETFPPMPQNVLRLNHSDILNRIMLKLKKSEAPHRCSTGDTELTQSVNENPIEYTSNSECRKAFKDFLEKREILRSKARKRENDYSPDMEYIKAQLGEFDEQYFKNLDIYDHYVDDVDEIDDSETM